jgi:hypothetical protein
MLGKGPAETDQRECREIALMKLGNGLQDTVTMRNDTQYMHRKTCCAIFIFLVNKQLSTNKLAPRRLPLVERVRVSFGPTAGRGGGRRLTKQLKQMEFAEQKDAEKQQIRMNKQDYLLEFGHSMQLSYKCENILEPQATLVYTSSHNDGNGNNENAPKRLKALEHLSKRVVVACGPRNEGE